MVTARKCGTRAQHTSQCHATCATARSAHAQQPLMRKSEEYERQPAAARTLRVAHRITQRRAPRREPKRLKPRAPSHVCVMSRTRATRARANARRARRWDRSLGIQTHTKSSMPCHVCIEHRERRKAYIHICMRGGGRHRGRAVVVGRKGRQCVCSGREGMFYREHM